MRSSLFNALQVCTIATNLNVHFQVFDILPLIEANHCMNYPWSKTVFPIAAIFSFRMLGLFMLIPIFTLYAPHLQKATPLLIGIALGAYGLSQGLLQLPFGLLSDRFGRKKIILLGLMMFALGSLLGALTHHIYGMIIARIFQGSGAIGSVLMALLADLTPPEQRTKGMAVIGSAIGISFSLAMIISPIITQHYGFSGIFYLSTILAVFGIILLYKIIPEPNQALPLQTTHLSLLKSVISNPSLLRLNLGIFFQHAILTATFFILPLLLVDYLKQGYFSEQWHFYLVLITLSFLLMIPLIIFSEKKQYFKHFFLLTIFSMAASQFLLFFFAKTWIGLCLLLLIYFIAFNFLEATLPSLVSKKANPSSKGTAMGVYSSFQFFGIFMGGLSAGIIVQWGPLQAIFIFNALLGLFWLLCARKM